MPAVDNHRASPTGQNSVGTAAAVTPHDVNDLAFVSRAIYVGGAGNVTVTMNGANVTLTGVPAGTLLPIRVSRVMSTGTTATNIVAFE